MPPNSDFSLFLKYVDDPNDTIIALDFDQTITIKVTVHLQCLRLHSLGAHHKQEDGERRTSFYRCLGEIT